MLISNPSGFHFLNVNDTPANNGEIFLPSLLRYYGYHTAISGKLHYAPKRFDFGFDQFWSFTNKSPGSSSPAT